MSTMESLHSKLQQLHIYIRRLGELTSSPIPTTQPTVIVTSPGKQSGITHDDIDHVDLPGHHKHANSESVSSATLTDIDTIQQWLTNARQHISTHTTTSTQCHTAALLSQLAATVRTSSTVCANQSSNNSSKVNLVKAKTAHYSTLQPAKPTTTTTLAKPTLIAPHAALQPVSSSVPIRDYSPANTAFVNGVWVNTDASQAGSDDCSVDDLDSIDDFDMTPQQPARPHVSHTTNTKQSKTQHNTITNVIKPFSLSTATTPAHKRITPRSVTHDIDPFDDALEQKINSGSAALPSSDTTKGQFVVPVDTKFVNGRWQSNNEQSNELDDVDDFDGEDCFDGDGTAGNGRISTHNSISPTSRASVQSDMADFSDEDVEQHVAAKKLPAMTLIRADQYQGSAPTKHSHSLESTELDAVSDFDDDNMDDPTKQRDGDSEDDVRNDLDNYMDDDDDTDSVSINDAQHALKLRTGSTQIVDKSKIQLNEFDLSDKLLAQWRDEAQRYVQFMAPILRTAPQPVDPIKLILHGVQSHDTKMNNSIHREEKQAETYVDDIDDL